MTRWIPPVTAACHNGNHRGCSGCEGCSCHHVPPPRNFRALVRALRENYAREGQ